MVDAIILAGGLGTRLRESVPHLPKPLAPINGVPFLDLLLRQIRQIPLLGRIVLAVGYKASYITDYYRESDLLFSVEDTPLGTGGALKKALPLTTSTDVLVLNGDSYLDFSFSKLQESHQTDILLACLEVPDASRYGKITLDSSSGRILSFHEKSATPEPGLINAGVYLMKRDALAPWEGAFSLEKDVFPHAQLCGCLCSGKFIDIGTTESFTLAQRFLT